MQSTIAPHSLATASHPLVDALRRVDDEVITRLTTANVALRQRVEDLRKSESEARCRLERMEHDQRTKEAAQAEELRRRTAELAEAKQKREDLVMKAASSEAGLQSQILELQSKLSALQKENNRVLELRCACIPVMLNPRPSGSQKESPGTGATFLSVAFLFYPPFNLPFPHCTGTIS